jgi:signal transduction histidine kinase
VRADFALENAWALAHAFSLLSMLSCAGVALLSVFFWKVRGGLALAGLNTSLALWQFGKLWALSQELGSPTFLWAQQLSLFGALWVPYCFLILALQVGMVPKGLRLWDWKSTTGHVLLFGILSIIVLSLGLFNTWIVQDPYWTSSGVAHYPGPLYSWFLVYYGVVFLYALRLFLPGIWWQKRSLRKQQWAIAISAVVGMGLGSLDFVSTLWGIQSPWSNLAPLLFAFGLSWSLYRFDIVDGVGLSRRLLVYVGVVLSLIAVFALADWIWRLLVGGTHLPWIFVALCVPMGVVLWNRILSRMDPVGHVRGSDWRNFQTWLSQQQDLSTLMDGVMVLGSQRGYHSMGVVFWDESQTSEPSQWRWRGNQAPQWFRKRWNRWLESGETLDAWNQEFGALHVLHQRALLQRLRFKQIPQSEKRHLWRQVRFLGHLQAEIWLPLVQDSKCLGAIWMSEPSRLVLALDKELEALQMVARILVDRIVLLNLFAKQGREARLAEIGFLTASLAHQLRNPLESILGAAEVLRLAPGSATEEMIGIIHKEGQRLEERIALFLRWTKKIEVEWSQFDLWQWLQHTHPHSAKTQLVGEAALMVLADPECLQQILEILLHNAQKHAATEAQILCCRGKDYPYPESEASGNKPWSDTSILCICRDQGPGVKDPGRIFQPFYTTSASGHGLGLALALQLSRAMGGDLKYFSAAHSGGGSDFILVLQAGSSYPKNLQGAEIG